MTYAKLTRLKTPFNSKVDGGVEQFVTARFRQNRDLDPKNQRGSDLQHLLLPVSIQRQLMFVRNLTFTEMLEFIHNNFESKKNMLKNTIMEQLDDKRPSNKKSRLNELQGKEEATMMESTRRGNFDDRISLYRGRCGGHYNRPIGTISRIEEIGSIEESEMTTILAE